MRTFHDLFIADSVSSSIEDILDQFQKKLCPLLYKLIQRKLKLKENLALVNWMED